MVELVPAARAETRHGGGEQCRQDESCCAPFHGRRWYDAEMPPAMGRGHLVSPEGERASSEVDVLVDLAETGGGTG